jgi:hypothetical protein
MGAVVNFMSQKWRAQRDDLIGGWCITPAADKRTPAEGAPTMAGLFMEDTARHVAKLHNNWLEGAGESK